MYIGITVQNSGVSKTFLNKYFFLYSKDSLNDLEVTKHVLMLQKIYISNNCCKCEQVPFSIKQVTVFDISNN